MKVGILLKTRRKGGFTLHQFKESIVYQIWPRSFYDSNGDGIGDIAGITKKLEYIHSLGVNLIWLCPIYATHNKDYGYDIDNYYEINPEYGTMKDFDELVNKANALGIGILMDLVPNHTSNQHPWFQEALKDKNSPFRDHYFFHEPRSLDDNGLMKQLPPNNWLSAFGGSAWQYHEPTNEYYLTMFTPNQCDLNWENENVRNGIYDVMNFWMDKGIAGFRLDVINVISKREGLPIIGDPNKLEFPFQHIISLPKSHTYLKEMQEKVLKPRGCITVGEGMAIDLEDLISYTNPKEEELNMMFHFDLHLLGCGKLGKYDFRKLYYYTIQDMKQVIDHWQVGTQKGNGWLGNYLSNHDQPRQVSRFGNDNKYHMESAKALALLNFTLRGTPFLYQGEEIGMTNCKLEKTEWKDYEAMNAYEVLQSMMHLPSFLAKKIIMKMTRDHARTPMQWTPKEYAGFSTVTPWIKLNPNYKTINVASDLARKDSLIEFYKKCIQLRKKYETLIYGQYIPLCRKNKQVIVYLRQDEKVTLLIAINLSAKKAKVNLSDTDYVRGVLLLGTHLVDGFSQHFELKPYEGRLYMIK